MKCYLTLFFLLGLTSAMDYNYYYGSYSPSFSSGRTHYRSPPARNQPNPQWGQHQYHQTYYEQSASYPYAYQQPDIEVERVPDSEVDKILSMFFPGMETSLKEIMPEYPQESEEEEIIELPHVEEQNVINDVLNVLMESLMESKKIKEREETKSKEVVTPKPTKTVTTTPKPEVPKETQPILKPDFLEPLNCEFEYTDFLFPDKEIERRVRLCQEKMPEIIQPPLKPNSTEMELEPMPEKHIVNGEECVCVAYFQCENDTVITDGKSLIDVRFQDDYEEIMKHPQGVCSSDLDVCCKLKPKNTSLFPDIIPPSKELENMKPMEEMKEIDKSGSSEMKSCTCVPYYQCTLDDKFVTGGEGIIDVRFGSGESEGSQEKRYSEKMCDNILEVCCFDE